MPRLARALPLVLGSLLLACDGPTTPDRLAPASPALDRTAASSAACYPVRFRSVSEAFREDGAIVGTVAGDVEGTFVVWQDLSQLKFAGVTARIPGTFTLTVTGGILPGPFPLTMTGSFEQLNQNRISKASPEWIYEQNVTLRATGGVKAANLRLQGTFDATTGTVDHEWWGVICP